MSAPSAPIAASVSAWTSLANSTPAFAISSEFASLEGDAGRADGADPTFASDVIAEDDVPPARRPPDDVDADPDERTAPR